MILALCLAGETDRADPQLQVTYVVFEAPGKSTRTASVEHDRRDVPRAWIFSLFRPSTYQRCLARTLMFVIRPWAGEILLLTRVWSIPHWARLRSCPRTHSGFRR